VTPQNPARSGETVVVYGTGVGQIENAPADGAASPVNPPATCTVTPTIIVSSSVLGASAKTIYCGLTADFVSLIQINVQLPIVQSPETTWKLGIRFGDTGNFVFIPIHFAP
jgi:uncharacterized protein (TIGR03437 family)